MNENKKEEDLENQEEVLIDEGNSLDLESEDELPEEPSEEDKIKDCLLYTSPSPRDATLSRMPSSA